MKLTTLLLIVTMLQVSAGSYAQRITLSQKNAVLVEVFDQIRIQTGYDFIFNNSILKGAKKVTISVKNAELEDVLKQIFAHQPLKYKINDNKSVVVTKKDKSILDKVIGYFSTIDVTGKVVDELGLPLPGASVKVKGGPLGTVTDKEGDFFLKGVPEGAVIVIAYLGYNPLELTASTTVGLIKLELASSELTEVVINKGYYITTKELNTGSVSKVTAKEIERQPVINPLGALIGRMSGVSIQQTTGIPGGEFNIQIRGRNSLRDDGNDPLYIIDGVPFSTEKTFSSFATGAFGLTLGQDRSGSSSVSPLTSINPSDIESIEILKDADATAIYGSRGANGVVLISTKKGKIGKTKLDLNVYSGIGKANKLQLLDTETFLNLRREAFANDEITPNAIPGTPGYSPELMIWDTKRYTDWQDILTGGSARTTSLQGSISGGSDNTQFLFSAGYRAEDSVYPNNLGYQKASSHLAINHQSNDKRFTISVNVNATKDTNTQLTSSYYYIAKLLAPNSPAIYNDQGGLNWENSTWENPLASQLTRYSNEVLTFTSNSNVGYKITSDLEFSASVGGNYLNSNESAKYPHTYQDPAAGWTSAQSSVHVANGTNQSWLLEPKLNWKHVTAYGTFSALIGSTFQDQRLDRKADYYKGFPSDALIDDLSSASLSSNSEFVASIYRYNALFGRINYNWDNKYIINLTARRDGSSRFGSGRQFSNFGAFGMAWNFYNEDFVKSKLPVLSFGKFRISYGTTGSDQIGNYQYLDTYTTEGTVLNNQYQGVIGLSPGKLYNPDYAWESNKKFEAALELGFLKDRLLISTVYFQNRSTNQLINYTLPSTTGFSGILANLPATVQNKGIEFEFSSRNLQSKNYTWSSAINLTVPRNELIAFPNLSSSTYANKYIIGRSLSSYRFLQYTGVDVANGLYTFKDVNGDGKISRPEDDSTTIDVTQSFFGGFNNNLSYMNWSLDISMQFVKQLGFDAGRTGLMIPGWQYNFPKYLLEGKIWRKPGDIAKIQKLATKNNVEADKARADYAGSDATIGDASFIRLKNVSLSYTLPKRFTNDLFCRLYFQGQNLLTLTKYKGDDPENQVYISMPALKVFTFGLQLTL